MRRVRAPRQRALDPFALGLLGRRADPVADRRRGAGQRDRRRVARLAAGAPRQRLQLAGHAALMAHVPKGLERLPERRSAAAYSPACRSTLARSASTRAMPQRSSISPVAGEALVMVAARRRRDRPAQAATSPRPFSAEAKPRTSPRACDDAATCSSRLRARVEVPFDLGGVRHVAASPGRRPTASPSFSHNATVSPNSATWPPRGGPGAAPETPSRSSPWRRP